MTDIKWIKISTEMFSDEKIKVIEAMPEADTVLLIWIKLLSLAGRTNAGGYIFLTEDVPYTEDTLSTVMGRPKTVVSMALTIFVKFKMIIISDNGYLLISNWERYQNVDGMERIRALTAVRTQEYRKRKAIQSCDVTVTLPVTDVTQTDIVLRTKNKELNTLSVSNETDEPKIVKPSKKPKKINTSYPEILSYWNSKEIIVHKVLSTKSVSLIKSKLDSGYTIDDIKEAIKSYWFITTNTETKESYWFTYKFTLEDFLNPKNFEKFKDFEAAHTNFLIKEEKRR